jgi:transposase-like protein
MDAFHHSDSEPLTISPQACPACGSTAVKTTAKHPDIDSYWRCEGCGEIWNIGRRHAKRNGVVPWR